MTFLVSARHGGSIFAGMTEDRLTEIRQAIQDGFDAGKIQASYAFVNGGSLWIIEAESELVVARLLRSLGVKNADVTALVRTLDLLDAHLEHRRTLAAAQQYELTVRTDSQHE
jgi:hypothetical protein